VEAGADLGEFFPRAGRARCEYIEPAAEESSAVPEKENEAMQGRDQRDCLALHPPGDSPAKHFAKAAPNSEFDCHGGWHALCLRNSRIDGLLRRVSELVCQAFAQRRALARATVAVIHRR
jgi:hypothetical protein